MPDNVWRENLKKHKDLKLAARSANKEKVKRAHKALLKSAKEGVLNTNFPGYLLKDGVVVKA